MLQIRGGVIRKETELIDLIWHDNNNSVSNLEEVGLVCVITVSDYYSWLIITCRREFAMGENFHQ